METSRQRNHTKQRYRNAFYDCDHLGRMKLSTMLKLTAEVAGYDYVIKGIDHEFLWERGYVFLLSRISMRINFYPLDQTELVSTTWEAGKKGAMFIRENRIESEKGVCCEGVSGWILCNPTTRKIYKPSEFPFPQEQFTDEEINCEPVGRIKTEAKLQDAGTHTVVLSDLDSNGHVYNANYADIAQNSLTMEEYSRPLENFRINFLSEAVIGEEIRLTKSVVGRKAVVCGEVVREGCGVPCFECEFLFGEEER